MHADRTYTGCDHGLRDDTRLRTVKWFQTVSRQYLLLATTITKVGYGDNPPVTALGKFVASIIMLMGYAIIAVPPVSLQLNGTCHAERAAHRPVPVVGKAKASNASFCKICGKL
ncbi:MAG: two pore domain potassium channel family protein [Chitinophagaceae bacterium]|nr:two pore domain potassium channel family protein [Chitinophagaceae bacterium]